VRVKPLHPKCDTWCDFPVADRPNAVAQWLETEDSKLGRYILLIETDYIWTKPVPMPIKDDAAVAFKYDYINPKYPGIPQIMKVYYSGDVDDIPCTGPAPVLLRTDLLRRIVPTWVWVTEGIETTDNHRNKLGWVREMYAYSLAAAITKVPHIVEPRYQSVLIAQPPADDYLGKAAMYHYTWGVQLLDPMTQKKVWEWDKRAYVAAMQSFKIPIVPMPPPVEDIISRGLLQHYPQKKTMKRELAETFHQMLGIMNNASRDLPTLRGCGWQGYPRCPSDKW